MALGVARVYRLTHPGQFEVSQREIDGCPSGRVVVRPTMGSICAADLRYYLGRRRPEALRRKLPMALLHEAIGIVEVSNAPGLSPGDRVVLVPNIPGYIHSPDKFPNAESCCPACASSRIGENYCRNIHFLSSGFDGFTCSSVVHPAECAVKIPAGLDDEVAVLAELATVSMCAVLRTLGIAPETVGLGAEAEVEAAIARERSSSRRESVGVWGDGPVGYSVATWLGFLGVTKEQLVAFGTSPTKLSNFEFATTVDIGDFGQDAVMSHGWGGRLAAAFECVGGEMQSVAANDAIDCLQPGGRLGLLGVNEGLTPLNVRDVLEKGLTLLGCSRSPRQSYPIALALLVRNAFLREHFRRLVIPPIAVRNVEGLQEAFHFASGKAEWGKVLVQLDL